MVEFRMKHYVDLFADELALIRSTWMDETMGWWKFQRELGEDIYEFIFTNTS